MSDDQDIIFDDDNPEWTEEDFARALKGSELPPEVLAAFGPGKVARMVPEQGRGDAAARP